MAAIGCVALALWTYRSVLHHFFSPDDLVLLEWVQGLVPAPATLWRCLSGRLYFGAAFHAFGANPYLYLLVNWALHGANVALVYILMRRLGASSLAATLAAGLFGSSRLFLSVVGQAVGIGDLLALGLSLLTSIAMTLPTWRAAAAGSIAFLLALLSKETVIGLPLALLATPAVGDTLRARAGRLAPLFAIGAAWMGYLSLTGVSETALGGPAYAIAFGGNLLDSLLMYSRWAVSLRSVAPEADSGHPGLSWVLSACVVGVVVVLAVLVRRHSRIPLMGSVWWLAGIAPILPLLHQKHLHYLYAPSVGLALWAGSIGGVAHRAWTSKDESRRRAMVAWALAAVLLLGHGVLSASLIQRRHDEMLPGVDLPKDAFIRKMEIARRATSSIGVAMGDRPARVAFYNPVIRGRADFFTNLLPAVLDHGRGLQALYPNIDSVVFVRRWLPALSDFEIVVANEDGHVLVLGRGPEANLRLIQLLEANGFQREADDLIKASIAAYPTDPVLQTAVHSPTSRR